MKQNYPNNSLLKDIHNYLSLSDLKLSFDENHVASIMYLFGYKETNPATKDAYVLGRVQPRSRFEYSELTLRFPSQRHETTRLQIQSFLSSSKNLNGLFSQFDNVTNHSNQLSTREQQLKNHVEQYIEDCYQDYLQKTKQKGCSNGRVIGFTTDVLGAMPKSVLPQPLSLPNHRAKDILIQFQKDVDRAVLICYWTHL